MLLFGLNSDSATFQSLIEKVLQELHWQTLLLYLDDITVVARDFSTHLERLAELFQQLRAAGLKLKPAKCEVLKKEVLHFCHIVNSQEIATDLKKIVAIRKWGIPKDVKELQAFLGTARYYQQYVKQYATIARPLHCLIAQDTPWEWCTAADRVFQELKN